jgi:hypothetical protein
MDTDVSLATTVKFHTLGKRMSITETAYKLMVSLNSEDPKRVNCGRIDKYAKLLKMLTNALLTKFMELQINAISVNHAHHQRMEVFRLSQMLLDSDVFFQLLKGALVTKSIVKICQDVSHVTTEIMKMET